ncbi:hypothetical protein GBO34_00895 [Roseivirga pacifica]|uniref:hypothetical protein n=1 Tax=Roseivirga pacifica TaxID=1267423 RepID=UPI002094D9B4|nr:hypothetical protein [Roseivirga pacifica]MCO6367870.1 hypothetical protein [Roseivirga pacifica]MCO6377242.1 hypothetical protein [Roseivirga pacifica]
MASLQILELNSKSNTREGFLMTEVNTLITSINSDTMVPPHAERLKRGLEHFFKQMDAGKSDGSGKYSSFFEIDYNPSLDPHSIRVYHLNAERDRDRLIVEVYLDREESNSPVTSDQSTKTREVNHGA